MNKDELLKIYSAYLPYGVELYHESNFKENRTIKYWGLKNCSDYPISEYCDGTRYGRTFQEVKPILYDLSYLTKEIEHEGEKFVPMSRLFSDFGYLPNTSHHEHLQVQVYFKLNKATLTQKQ